jgi:hypothetical protein
MYRHSLRLTVGCDWLRSSVVMLLHRLPRGVVNMISQGILEMLVELGISCDHGSVCGAAKAG